MQKQNYNSYEEFCAGYQTEVPENFNFAFDVVDRIAADEPARPAMIHIGPDGTRRERDFEFFSKNQQNLPMRSPLPESPKATG